MESGQRNRIAAQVSRLARTRDTLSAAVWTAGATRRMSTFPLGPRQVRRSGYGAMQLAGPWAVNAPPDRASAISVLRAAVAAGIDHIDTAQYYGPDVVNELIREALYPYPRELAIVSKVGVFRHGPGMLWQILTARHRVRSRRG